jgi:hypothetical protein
LCDASPLARSGKYEATRMLEAASMKVQVNPAHPKQLREAG